MEHCFTPIGIIHSCFKQKFGIPRQPGLAPAARATLELLPPFNRIETIRGIEGFSHLWLVFVFHATAEQGWSPTVRPPRLGGNERLGVFATRSTFRPNPIGLSVVELEGITEDPLQLRLRGVDLLDGTPVLDIKPYLPYADALPDARAGFAAGPPPQRHRVTFTPEAAVACAQAEAGSPGLRVLIEQVLGLDPRPAYHDDTAGKRYGCRLAQVDVQWQVKEGLVHVVAVIPVVSRERRE